MALEASLREHLEADGAVAARVGGRVYPVLLPPDVTYEAISYRRISAPREHAQTGPSGLVRARIQVDSWATTYGGAKDLAEDVRRALDGFRGTMGTTVTTRVDSTMLEGDRDLYDEDAEVHRVQHDYLIWYGE
ncbi:MAG: DUF3168 domain-containing protein [Gemmatimonadota bacterium]